MSHWKAEYSQQLKNQVNRKMNNYPTSPLKVQGIHTFIFGLQRSSKIKKSYSPYEETPIFSRLGYKRVTLVIVFPWYFLPLPSPDTYLSCSVEESFRSDWVTIHFLTVNHNSHRLSKLKVILKSRYITYTIIGGGLSHTFVTDCYHIYNV